MNLPPERWSIVIAAIAVAAGWRADICTIAVPSFRRLVEAPHHASGVRQSDPYASAVQIESTPRRSASAIASTTPGGGPPAQYPVLSPSFSVAAISAHRPKRAAVRANPTSTPALRDRIAVRVR